MIEGKYIFSLRKKRQELLSTASYEALYHCPESTHPSSPASKEREASVKALLSFLAAACLWLWVAPAMRRGTPYGPQTIF